MSEEINRIVLEPECKKLTGLSRTTRWNMEKEGKFPKRYRLSVRNTGWFLFEIKEWLESRVRIGDKHE